MSELAIQSFWPILFTDLDPVSHCIRPCHSYYSDPAIQPVIHSTRHCHLAIQSQTLTFVMLDPAIQSVRRNYSQMQTPPFPVSDCAIYSFGPRHSIIQTVPVADSDPTILCVRPYHSPTQTPLFIVSNYATQSFRSCQSQGPAIQSSRPHHSHIQILSVNHSDSYHPLIQTPPFTVSDSAIQSFRFYHSLIQN